MIPTVTIGVVAGYLEGEGSFITIRSPRRPNVVEPRIAFQTTDGDVARRIAATLNRSRPRGPRPPRWGYGKKPWFQVICRGSQAVAWMMTIYPLMGERRQARIRAVLSEWRAVPIRSQHVGRIWAEARSRA